MKLAGCIKHTKTSYMPKDQGKVDLSCYGPFNWSIQENVNTKGYSSADISFVFYKRNSHNMTVSKWL